MLTADTGMLPNGTVLSCFTHYISPGDIDQRSCKWSRGAFVQEKKTINGMIMSKLDTRVDEGDCAMGQRHPCV